MFELPRCRKVFEYSRALWVIALLVAVVWPSAAAAQAGADALAAQRQAFAEAHEVLWRGRMEEYTAHERALRDYPLYPYLRYEYLRGRLDEVSAAEVADFLERYADTPLADRLRNRWLHHLGDAERWSTFLRFYRGGGGNALRCLAAKARLRTEPGPPSADLLKDIEALWLRGRSQPDACDEPFAAFRKAGALTQDLVWGRIERAMAARQPSLARYLTRFLDAKADRRWVERWREVYKRPKRTLAAATWHASAPVAETITRHGLRRLARRDAGEAMALWQELAPRYGVKDMAADALTAYIALHAALDRHPKALEWLAGLKAPDADAREWRLRAALQAGDWSAVLDAFEAMTPAQRRTDHWRYWQARALEALGKPGAQPIYRDLASRRGYHSFLASDRSGGGYALGHSPLEVDPKVQERVARLPGVVRARELFLLERFSEARREWLRALRGLRREELSAAAALARDWGWHDRAIYTVARARHLDDLEMRFPLAYRGEVDGNARINGLDPAWVFGMVRQESAFMPDAGSRAGARGLMQLMPATGKQVARLIDRPLRRLAELTDADRNLQLGTAYLKRMLERNGGSPVLATAAYNAGPYRVDTWRPERVMPADLWVETLPFNETRTYVKRVLAYASIYDWRLGREVRPLKLRMPAVLPDGSG